MSEPKTEEEVPLYTPVAGELQLTVRAVLTGCLIGGVVSAMNIYFGLKTGWSIGGSLIAAILGFSFFRMMGALRTAPRLVRAIVFGFVGLPVALITVGLLSFNGFAAPQAGALASLAGVLAVLLVVLAGVGMGDSPLTRLEVNIAQTSGSAAGSMTSAAGLLAPIPAMSILGQPSLSYLQLTLWSASVAWLGVFYAVPLRRQMVLVEKLRFPTGTATANTILAMFSEGAEAVKKSQYLVIFGILAAVFTLVNHFFGELSMPPVARLVPIATITVAAAYSIILYNSPLMWGAGILIGPRVACSLLLGALISWGILAPGVEILGWVPGHEMVDGQIKDLTMDYEKGARGWILWPGVAIMVADALTSLALSWRTILNTFTGGSNEGEAVDTSDDQIPNIWWMGGLMVAGSFTVATSWYLFGINPLLTMLAVAMSSVLAAIAVRSTGETDINPIGGMGKVTQLVYGGLSPGSVTTNLMSAAVTGSGASQAGDMMHDLKTGWLLGASPRKQLVAQLIGIGAGILVCVPTYMLFDMATDIGGVGKLDANGNALQVMPAPAAHAWAGMARVLSEGLDALPDYALYAVLGGLIFGTLLPILNALLKKPTWLPSGLAVGIAFIVPAFYSMAMFAGMVMFQLWRTADKKSADSLGFAVASGLIAGEGLTGVFSAVLTVLEIDRNWLVGLFS